MAAKKYEGVRITRPSLDDIKKETVLRGVISVDTMRYLRYDHYQRERLPSSTNREITRALEAGIALPDITLGMRGDRFAVEEDGSVVLLDSVYVIDGRQRCASIDAHLTKFPEDDPRIGATVYFNTNERTERERFHALNMFGTRVAANVLLRNNRNEVPLLASLYGVSQTDKDFALYRRVCWSQKHSGDQIMSAMAFIVAALHLHAHFAPTRSTALRAISPALIGLSKVVSIQQVRDNVAAFWNTLDFAWGVRNIQISRTSNHLKSGFLWAVTKALADYADFWDGTKFTPSLDIRNKLKKFPINDPEVARLASGHGKAREALFFLLVEHINSGKRTHRLRAWPDHLRVVA